MSTHHDPGLRVVARVRGVRERDSRIGLVEALTEERAARTRVADLEARLGEIATHESGDVVSFVTRQQHVDALVQALAAGHVGVESAQLVALAARDRWRTDRSRLAAVESLLERRAAVRLHERRRREGRELDAVGEELWRRRRAAGESQVVTP